VRELQIITRKQAKALGLTRYFTGKPCKHGHVCERYTANFACVECFRENRNRRYRDDPRFRDKALLRGRKRSVKKKKEISEYNKQYRDARPDEWRLRARLGRERRIEEYKQYNREYMTREVRPFIKAARKMGLIRKGDTPAEQYALIAYYKRIGFFRNEDLKP
jgi:hypothetical protein